MEYDINEWDDYAVEAAVRIAEDADDTIRQALAKGADRAIRVWDDAIAEAGLLDPGTKAQVLEAVVDDEEPDLILSGVQAGDDAFGATGVTLASRLGWEWAAVVNDLELGDDVATVHRELEGGVEELTDVDLPAVLTIQTGINDPRYASLRGIRQAQQKELAVQSLSDVGLDASVLDSPIEQTSLYEPESEGEATIYEGSADETAADLAELLRERGVAQ